MFVVFGRSRQCEGFYDGVRCSNIVKPEDDDPFMHKCTKCNKNLCIECVELLPAREQSLVDAYDMMLRPLDGLEVERGLPTPRADLSEVKEWIEKQKRVEHEEIVSVCQGDLQIDLKPTSLRLSKTDVDSVRGFALRVGPSMAGKFVGTHKCKDECGHDIEVTGSDKVLDLGKKGVLVLLIEKADGQRVETQPQPTHKLEKGDVIYVGLREPVCSSVLDFEETSGHPEEKAFPLFLEFDKFDLPHEFAGSVLGPPTENNKFGLDMRNAHGINVAGILTKPDGYGTSRPKVIFPVLADLELEAGDCAVVVRVPGLSTGCSRSMDIDHKIDKLFAKAKGMTEGELHPKAKSAVSEGHASAYPRHARTRIR